MDRKTKFILPAYVEAKSDESNNPKGSVWSPKSSTLETYAASLTVKIAILAS